MRIAALYDIHGNLPALEAVLDDVRRVGVDHVLVGGDVLPGPMPNEAMACVLALDIPTTFIHGNCEREVIAQIDGVGTSSLPAAVLETMRWTARELSPTHAAAIRSWPGTATLTADTLGDVLFCHATPRDDNEIFTRLTPEAALAPIFASVQQATVICGHTHMQFDRTVGRTRVVNAGSVGMPFGDTRACWLLLGPDIELKQTSYDREHAAERVRATRYPQATELADQSILNPPSEETMLGIMSQRDLASPAQRRS